MPTKFYPELRNHTGRQTDKGLTQYMMKYRVFGKESAWVLANVLHSQKWCDQASGSGAMVVLVGGCHPTAE